MDKRLRKRSTRKDGCDVWTAKVSLGRAENGKYRTTRFSFIGNKREANAALTVFCDSIAKGNFVKPSSSSFGEYVGEFLAAQEGRLAATTLQRYNLIARLHVIPKLGGVSLQKLTPAHLEAAYADWSATLSRQTVLHHHRFIHRVLSTALRQGRVTRNVGALVDAPRPDRRERASFSVAEVERLLARAAATPRFASLPPIITIALATGARRGELCGLRWQDVDLETGRISIRVALAQTKGAGVFAKAPKSGRSRVVDLPGSAIEALRRHRLERANTLGLDAVSPTSAVFPDLTPQELTDYFRRLVRAAGLRGSLHSLRHTSASMLLGQGVHPKIVQERLGHSNVGITLDLYSHTTETLGVEAARRLDDVLPKGFCPDLTQTMNRGNAKALRPRRKALQHNGFPHMERWQSGLMQRS